MPPTRATRRHVPDARYRYGFFGRYIRAVGGFLVVVGIAATFVAVTNLVKYVMTATDLVINAKPGARAEAWRKMAEMAFGVDPALPVYWQFIDYFLGIIGSWPVLLTLAVFGLLAVVVDWNRL